MGKAPGEWLEDLRDPSSRRSWKYHDLAKALESANAVLVSKKGSHRTFKHGNHPDLVTLVDRGSKPLPIGYVKDVVALLEAVTETEVDTS